MLQEQLSVLDNVRLNFTSDSLLVMNLAIAFVMFGVALQIKIKEFKEVVRNPKGVILGLLSQWVALPLVTFLLVMIIRPTQSVALGMILVAACPGGNVSNFISSISKANLGLSVTLTGLSSMSAVIITPFNFAFWGGLYSRSLSLPILEIPFIDMLRTVLILLGIPIILGMVFARVFPRTAIKIRKTMSLLSILVFIGFIIVAFSNNFSYFLKYIHLIALIVLLHNGLALLSGYSIGRAFKMPESTVRTITIETGIQNSGLGLALIFNPHLFNGSGGMAFIAAWWGIWHIVSGLCLAYYWSRKPIKVMNK